MKSGSAMEADDLGPLEEETVPPVPAPSTAGAPGEAPGSDTVRRR